MSLLPKAGNMMVLMELNKALQTIADEATRGELVFPTSARLALKVKQQLDNPRCHIDSASRLVQAEPLLAARTVALANSVAYNPGGQEITDVRSAVGRLGFDTVRMLAAALVTRQMAGILDRPEHHAIATQLWEHAAHVAALAHVIARRVGDLDPETAMFAGIVHEVGNFYLLSRAAEFPELLALGPTDWEADGESQIGRAVLGALGVPKSVTEAIEHYWHGELALPPRTLGDILLLADNLAPMESPLHPLRKDVAGASSDLVETVIGVETLHTIVQDSTDEFEALVSTLHF